MSTSIRDRCEIPHQHRWSTEDIFASAEQWEAAIEAIESQRAAVAAFAGQLREGPATLLACLEQAERLRRAMMPIKAWASLCYAVDTFDTEADARLDRARQIASRVSAAMTFLEPELLAIGLETLDRWIAQEPGLANFHRTFERLGHEMAHVRSPEVEELLSLADDPFGTTVDAHSVMVNTDLRFVPAEDAHGQHHELTQGTFHALQASPDRTLRRTAWEHYHDAHLSSRNAIGTVVAAGIKQLVFRSRARRYDSSLEAALAREQMPTSVFTNTIDTFRANLPIWHRYWRLRRKALGYDRLEAWDVKAPLTADTPQVPYSQAVDWISEGMSPLGEEYVRLIRRGCLEERWVDIYPNRGKRLGAFCSTGALPHPYVFMSYVDTLTSLSTLAHELGHAAHGYYSWKHQPTCESASPGQFLCETAANFNQAMVRHHLYRTQTDPAFRIAVIEEAMGNFYRYMFVMPTLARFEQFMHQRIERGQALTAQIMNAAMADLFQEGFGNEVAIDRARVGITWATFPTHICRNFYTFKYTLGIAAANALAADVLAGGEPAAARYLELLKAGNARPPLELMKQAGVDITTPRPLEAAFELMNQWLDRLEALLAQRTTA